VQAGAVALAAVHPRSRGEHTKRKPLSQKDF